MNKEKVPAPVSQEDFERIAASIRTAHEMGKRLKACGLTDRAVVLLLQDHSGVGRDDCKKVLHSLANLGFYLEKKIL
jgi:uncharacterized protein YcgL (UPF0745 family)